MHPEKEKAPEGEFLNEVQQGVTERSSEFAESDIQKLEKLNVQVREPSKVPPHLQNIIKTSQPQAQTIIPAVSEDDVEKAIKRGSIVDSFKWHAVQLLRSIKIKRLLGNLIVFQPKPQNV